MDKQEIIDLVITMKIGAIKLQIFEAASVLRSIENTFKGQFVVISQNPTIDNLSILLSQFIERTQDEESKSYLKSVFRDFKIDNLLK